MQQKQFWKNTDKIIELHLKILSLLPIWEEEKISVATLHYHYHSDF